MTPARASGWAPFPGWRRWAWVALGVALAADLGLMLRIALAESRPAEPSDRRRAVPRAAADAAVASRAGLPAAPDDAAVVRAEPSPRAEAQPDAAAAPAAADGRKGVHPAALAALGPADLGEALARIGRLEPADRDRALRILKRRLQGSARERGMLLSLVNTLEDGPALEILARVLLLRLEIPGTHDPAPLLDLLERDQLPARRECAASVLRRYAFVGDTPQGDRLLGMLRGESDPAVRANMAFALVNRSDRLTPAAWNAQVEVLERVAAELERPADRERLLEEAWSPARGTECDLDWLRRTQRKWAASPPDLRDAATEAFTTLALGSVREFRELDLSPEAVDEVLSVFSQVYRAASTAGTRDEVVESAGVLLRREDSPQLRSFFSSLAATESDPRRAQAFARYAASPTPFEDWEELSDVIRAED